MYGITIKVMETLKLNKIFVVGDDSFYVNEIVRNLKKEGFFEIETFTSQCDFKKSLNQYHNVCVIMQAGVIAPDELEQITALDEVTYLVVIASELSKDSVDALKKHAFDCIIQDDTSIDQLMDTMQRIWILEELSEQKQERKHALQAGITLLVSVFLVIVMAVFLSK